ncbi:MAG: NAD(P)-dependent oxidoreductase [Deltaproteobacteria bacterium]|nr:NAD(P)-dependent oxidoreductase [Deltaproteobacteria bacterium]
MPRTALLTGTPGAREQAVAAELGARGWEVRRLPFTGDAIPEVGQAAAGAEVVVHLGVRTSHERTAAERARAEAEAVSACARAARQAGAARFLLLSTASVYGRPRHLPCDEGELKRPRTPRERARWQAECAGWRALREGTPLVVLRPVVTYGPTLRGGAIRALSLIALLNQGRRRVPILRRGPVAHLVHLDDVARAVAFLAEHPRDAEVVGRAFNVGDEAPLPLGEHLAAAVSALGFRPGRILPTWPRLTRALLWLVRRLPDRLLFAPANRRLGGAWERLTAASGAAPALAPRLDREALHWMSGDHYYDTSRLAALGFRTLHPTSLEALPETVRSLVEQGLLPAVARR